MLRSLTVTLASVRPQFVPQTEHNFSQLSYLDRQLFLRPQFLPDREHNFSHLLCSDRQLLLWPQFGLSSYLKQNTAVLSYCLDRQLFLRPQFLPDREHNFSPLLCLDRQLLLRPQFVFDAERNLSPIIFRLSTVSSTSVRT